MLSLCCIAVSAVQSNSTSKSSEPIESEVDPRPESEQDQTDQTDQADQTDESSVSQTSEQKQPKSKYK